LKMKSLKIKATMARTTTAAIDLTRCQRNSSRCSQNDISLSFGGGLGGLFFVVLNSVMTASHQFVSKSNKSSKLIMFVEEIWAIGIGRWAVGGRQ